MGPVSFAQESEPCWKAVGSRKAFRKGVTG